MLFGAMAFQVFAKKDRGGHGVHRELRRISFFWCAVNLFGFAAELFFEQALGFPTGQSFIGHFDGNADLFAHTLREALRFLGHFAARAVETQRQSDQD